MDIKDLRTDWKQKIDEAEKIIKKADEEKRNLSPDEEKKVAALMQEADGLKAEIKQAESSAEIRAEITSLKKEASGVLREAPSMGFYGHQPGKNTFPKVESRKYSDLFRNSPVSNEGFETAEDFFQTVHAGRADDRLKKLEQRTFVAGTGAQGGFAVPGSFAEQIFDQSLQGEIVRSRAKVYPVETGLTISIPAWSHSDHDTSLYGGYSADWGAENSNAETQTGRLRLMAMTLKKCRLYTEVSREALTGGIDFEQQIGQSMIKSLGYFLDEGYISGNGVGRPKGFLNSGCLISINRANANAIGYTDVTNMYARLAPGVADGAVWLCNMSAVPSLLRMKDDSSALVWQPAYAGATGKIEMSLFGLPLIPTEKVPSLGITGDLCLCAFSEYAIALGPNVVLEASNSPGWARDVTSFRSIIFTDGQPLWEAAIEPRDGSTNTLSPFIALSSNV